MPEYIDKQKAKDELLVWATCIQRPQYLRSEDAMCVLDGIPAADVATVMHGRIVESWTTGHPERFFSCCGTDCTKMTQWIRPNYCPHCGAKMDRGEAT